LKESSEDENDGAAGAPRHERGQMTALRAYEFHRASFVISGAAAVIAA
jgi:hypothetical protein